MIKRYNKLEWKTDIKQLNSKHNIKSNIVKCYFSFFSMKLQESELLLQIIIFFLNAILSITLKHKMQYSESGN